QLKNTNSGLCIDIQGGANANMSNIDQWTCKTSNYDNQAWKFVSYNGYYQIRSKCGPNSSTCYGDGIQRCIDVTGGDTFTANGTNIELYQCGSSTTTKGNQTFNPMATSSSTGGGGTGQVGSTILPDCPGDPTQGWTEFSDTFTVQHPYNLPVSDRFTFDAG